MAQSNKLTPEMLAQIGNNNALMGEQRAQAAAAASSYYQSRAIQAVPNPPKPITPAQALIGLEARATELRDILKSAEEWARELAVVEAMIAVVRGPK